MKIYFGKLTYFREWDPRFFTDERYMVSMAKVLSEDRPRKGNVKTGSELCMVQSARSWLGLGRTQGEGAALHGWKQRITPRCDICALRFAGGSDSGDHYLSSTDLLQEISGFNGVHWHTWQYLSGWLILWGYLRYLKNSHRYLSHLGSILLWKETKTTAILTKENIWF